jgi:sugar phosphate isomerase/epimerase
MTVFSDPGNPHTQEVKSIQRFLQKEELQFCGFHWLLRHDAKASLVTEDATTFIRSWETIHTFSDIAGQIGGGVLIIGSGRNRQYFPPQTQKDARDRFIDGLLRILPKVPANVIVGLEPLPRERTNVINTIGEAYSIINMVRTDRVGLVFDLRSASSETPLGWDQLCTMSWSPVHVHLQDVSGYPLTEESPGLKMTLNRLEITGYSRWISLEPFALRHCDEDTIRDMAKPLTRFLG